MNRFCKGCGKRLKRIDLTTGTYNSDSGKPNYDRWVVCPALIEHARKPKCERFKIQVGRFFKASYLTPSHTIELNNPGINCDGYPGYVPLLRAYDESRFLDVK